jgi:Flp pilus assembly protein TadD
MSEQVSTDECPSSLLIAAAQVADGQDEDGLMRVDALLNDYPRDPRLHFLRGSLLAGLKRYDEAQDAMARAVALAPDYAIARFQLGFLLFTSGRPSDAEVAWERLRRLSVEDPLRLFAMGLEHLGRDEFEACIKCLRDGIALNTELPPVNRDMQLIIDQVSEILSANSTPNEEPVSATHLLLKQYRSPTKH